MSTTPTLVGRFAAGHAAGPPAQPGDVFRDRVPLSSPGPGEQYAFEVDLDSCTGCKACVTACHSLNGLDDGESWRSVGLLIGPPTEAPYQQTVTAGCHHCVEPACLAGCPVDAYEKDPTTGIVVHLDDQCIGCRYCTLTCPYEVPSYHDAKGIVRKCDMCRGRLAAGEAPACVDACPNGAIAIVVVDQEERRSSARAPATLVPGAPPSSTTVPTTRYRGTPIPAGAVAVDRSTLVPAHRHPPLTVMLVLTQLAVGAFVVEAAVRALGGPGAWATALGGGGTGAAWSGAAALPAAVAPVAGIVALAASVGHLGRPRLAYRAVLGIGHSWLSREIVAFGAFASIAVAAALVRGVRSWPAAAVAVDLAGVMAGGAGVACSVAVYAVTGRRWWRAAITGPKFALTTLLTGALAVLAVLSALSVPSAPGAGSAAPAATVRTGLVIVAVASAALKLGAEAVVLRHRRAGIQSDLGRTALLLTRTMATATWWRFGLGVAGGIVLPAAVARTSGGVAAALAAAALLATVAGELVERDQFFSAASAPSMPGLPR